MTPSRWLALSSFALFACSDEGPEVAPLAEQESAGPGNGGISNRDDAGGATVDGGPTDSDDDAPGAEPDPDASSAFADASTPSEDAGPGPPRVDGGPQLSDGAVSYCGDGVHDEEHELCDPEATLRFACPDLGFSGGDLSCDDGCQFDTSLCRGNERCTDGRDNDGDGEIDCIDADCEAACADTCESIVTVEGSPAGVTQRVDGTTVGHASELEPSCAGVEGGAEVVYRYVPANDGMLEVSLESGSLLLVSARTTCGEGGSELACGLIGSDLEVPIIAGERIFLAVDGYDDVEEAGFVMFLSERDVSCGNGAREGDEPCDDGNDNDEDGCSNACDLNPAETEPNDDAQTANDYRNPHYGEVAPTTDVDFTRFELPSRSTVRVRVFDLGDDACADATMDPFLEVYDEELELVAGDDDSGEGYCPEVGATLDAGSYFAAVSRASAGAETFPYRLVFTFAPPP